MTHPVDDATLVAFREEVGEEGPVAVVGGRTRWALGGELSDDTREIRAPVGIVAHQPEEMTVRVRAGTPVAELHEALSRANQRTALPGRGGTVGGALATGEDDLCSLGRGRVRAALLEITYVSADGRLVRGGAPTVKNVSGFDLPRLMVGALGTLGLLAEAVLRTQPVPQRAARIRAEGVDANEVAVTAPHASAVLHDGTSTYVELEGYDADVQAELAALSRLGDWEDIEELPAGPPHRWSLEPAALRTLDASRTGKYLAAFGSGIVLAERPRTPRRIDEAVLALASRMKTTFDPAGRLNPGRDPMAVVR